MWKWHFLMYTLNAGSPLPSLYTVLGDAASILSKARMTLCSSSCLSKHIANLQISVSVYASDDILWQSNNIHAFYAWPWSWSNNWQTNLLLQACIISYTVCLVEMWNYWLVIWQSSSNGSKLSSRLLRTPPGLGYIYTHRYMYMDLYGVHIFIHVCTLHFCNCIHVHVAINSLLLVDLL